MHLQTDFSDDNDDNNHDHHYYEYADDDEDGDADGSAMCNTLHCSFDKLFGLNKCMLDGFPNQIICTNTNAQYFAWSVCFVELGAFKWI